MVMRHLTQREQMLIIVNAVLLAILVGALLMPSRISGQ